MCKSTYFIVYFTLLSIFIVFTLGLVINKPESATSLNATENDLLKELAEDALQEDTPHAMKRDNSWEYEHSGALEENGAEERISKLQSSINENSVEKSKDANRTNGKQSLEEEEWKIVLEDLEDSKSRPVVEKSEHEIKEEGTESTDEREDTKDTDEEDEGDKDDDEGEDDDDGDDDDDDDDDEDDEGEDEGNEHTPVAKKEDLENAKDEKKNGNEQPSPTRMGL